MKTGLLARGEPWNLLSAVRDAVVPNAMCVAGSVPVFGAKRINWER